MNPTAVLAELIETIGTPDPNALTHKERNRYADNPTGWLTEQQHEHLWSKQREVLESVRDNRRTAVHASHGVGKSWLAARAVCWWVTTKPDSFVVTTAPTLDQVKTILWREINNAHATGNLDGECNILSWNINGRQVAIGRKTANTNPHSFQGIHAKHLLVVADEASGLSPDLWTGINKLTTGSSNRVLAIGNPDVQGSEWHKVCQSERWNVIHIDAIESPNFTDEEIPDSLRAELVDKEFVDDAAATYGEDSATYTKMIRGLFPGDTEDKLISRTNLAKCRHTTPQNAPKHRTVGIDVGASASGDHTVITLVDGGVYVTAESFREPNPQKVAHRTAQIVADMKPDQVNIDSIGVGHGLVGHLRDLLNCPVKGINVAEAASDRKRWANLKAELWWRVRTEAAAGNLNIGEMPDATFEQLVNVGWDTDTKNRIRVESKDAIRSRSGRSPDEADSYVLAVWSSAGTVGYTAGDEWLDSAGIGRADDSWDPWA